MDKLDLFKQSATQMGYAPEEVDSFLGSVGSLGESPEIKGVVESAPMQSTTQDTESFPGYSMDKMLSSMGPVTQKFGNRSPIERYSGGINYGTDFGVPKGTAVALPEGKWKVLSAFGGASEGNRGVNRGYGNSVFVENALTGEKLRFSHLSKVGVNPGQLVEGGSVIAFSGNTGNSTGPHLDLEAYDSTGRIVDVLKTPYAKYLWRSKMTKWPYLKM